MKKIACLFLCLLLLLQLGACNASVPSSTETKVEGTTQVDFETQATERETASETALPPVTTAEIGEQVIYLFEGDRYTLHTTLNTTDPDASSPIWSASTDAVSVENGVVTALHEGYAIVSAGGDRVCSVRVLALDMPTISINTGGVEITSKDSYVPCLVNVESSYADFCFEKASAGIRLRGNSTFKAKKKPYRIKFNSKRNLLGMNEGGKYKSWVLLAEQFDHTKIHNSTALSLASMIVTEYTSDWRYVELYLDGAYEGIYLLAEQSQIKEGRVDIEEAGTDSDALESGYLFEQDRNSDEIAFELDATKLGLKDFLGDDSEGWNMRIRLKNDGLSVEQIAFAEKYFKNVFQIIYSATYENKYYAFDEDYNLVLAESNDPQTVISAVVDVNSLVRKYIHSEFVCNSDDHKYSYYTHVDLSEGGTGLFTFSCPWDYDYAFQNWEDKQYYPTDEFFAAKRVVWYVMIMNHEWFRDMVSVYWNQLYAETDGFAAVYSMMEKLTQNYAEEFQKNSTRWSLPSQSKEVTRMYNWMSARIAWLNARFGQGDFFN